MQQKNITVYCSASENIDSKFLDLGKLVATSLVHHQFGIVYGGGGFGIMGTLARKAIEVGGCVTGITVKHIENLEKPFKDVSQFILVDSMAERKKLLSDYAHGFLVLPGGFGTFDEIFEVITLKILKVIHKPIVFFNYNNFFTPLITYLQTLETQGFAQHQAMSTFKVIDNIEDIMIYFKNSL